MSDKLRTLSAKYEALDKDKLGQEVKWELLGLHKGILDATIELKHVILCNAKGEPMEKPPNIQANDEQDILDAHEYRQALKSIVLEGWELGEEHPRKECINVVNKLNQRISFWHKGSRRGQVTYSYALIKIKTFADLAEITSHNPIKLRQ